MPAARGAGTAIPDRSRAPRRGRWSMDTKNDEQNLLFALVALKMGLIDDAALVAALNAWSGRKDRPLGHVLVERKSLAGSTIAAVEETCLSLLNAVGGDPAK